MRNSDRVHDWLEDENDRIWHLFHINSKNRSTELSSLFLTGYALFQQQPEQLLPFAVDELSYVPLSKQSEFGHSALEQEIVRRTSSLSFNADEFSMSHLATLLRSGFGGIAGTSAPSAGGLYPIDLFCAALSVDELESGLYFYDRNKERLGKILGSEVLTKLQGVFVQNEEILKARVILFFVATFERTIRKYGERGYRYAYLEAGHIAQNILLISGQLGLAASCIGGYLDQKAENLIGIDGERQSVVYTMVVG